MEITSTEEPMDVDSSQNLCITDQNVVSENNISEVPNFYTDTKDVESNDIFNNKQSILEQNSINSEVNLKQSAALGSDGDNIFETTINDVNKVEIITNNSEISNHVIADSNSGTENIFPKSKSVTKARSKKLLAIDSDSEDDANNFKSDSDKDESTNKNENIVKSNQKNKIHTLIDSDGDSNGSFTNDNDNVTDRYIKENVKSNRKNKIRMLIDSDDDSNGRENFTNNDNVSDKESENISQENFENNEIDITKKKSRIKLYDSDSSDDEIIKSSSESQKSNSQNDLIFETEQSGILKSRLTRLCDSESSADETEINHEHNFEESENQEIPWSYKKRKEKVEKPKKMTGKEAAEQRKQIMSENQRMVRETRVSLPYHRAKSHTLEEFMKKRAEIPDIVRNTKSIPNHMNIKMSIKQMELAAKQLEEREKVLDEFYKSDDESEDDSKVEKEEENSKVNNNSENELKKSVEKSDNAQSEKIDDAIEHVRKNLFDDEDTEKFNKEQDKELNESGNIFSSGDKENDTEVVIVSESNTESSQVSKETQSEDKNSAEDLTEDEILKIIEERENAAKEHVSEENISTKEDLASKENNSQNEDVFHEEILIEKYSQQEIKTPQPKTNRILEKLKKLNPLLAMKTNFQPRITGNSSDVIILDDDVEKSRGVNELKKRFIAHSHMKPVHTKDESHIAAVDTNILKHESAKVLIDHDDDHRVIESKPGEKFKKLRKELEQQMAKKRLEQWELQQQELQQKKKEDEEFYDGEKDDCEIIVEDDEEEEMTDSGTSDSDEDEDDMIIEDKPRVQSAFVDDEAEESEREEEEDGENEDNDEENEDNDQEEDDTNSEHSEENEEQNKKPLKRIITTFSDDSEDEIQLDQTIKDSINRIISSGNKDDLPTTDDEDEIPLYQIENLNKTPRRVPETKSDLNLTPSLYLSALKERPSDAKGLLESPGISYSLSETSPLKNHPGLKTKLFPSTQNDSLSQAFDELEALCSGKFTAKSQTQSLNVESQEELLGLISGKFDGIEELHKNDVEPTQISLDDLIQNSSETQNKETVLTKDTEENYVSFDFNDDSQSFQLTIDNDFFEQETEIEKNVKKPVVEIAKRKLVIVSSDDEPEENVSLKKKKKKTKKRKLDFSDDEQSSDNEDIQEFLEEPSMQYTASTNVQDINYDSEENEIEFDENEESVPTEKVAKTFFENEAELSESEWGSADEDERDLDEMDREDGDEEQFNERKLQKELGKIHMRQVLDQDNREVRLLQELLLEDGELHGAGRERKFKWKNADSLSWNDSEQPKEDDEENEDIPESELLLRKTRYERETFLDEHRKKIMETTNEVELLTNDSQIMKLGFEALKKSVDTSVQSKNVPPNIENNKAFSLLNKRSFRGSFLTRSENTLSRLAEMTKVSSKEVLASGPKNSRNFVFTSVTKTDEVFEEGVEKSDKKRKVSVGTPKVLKKMRIAENSPGGVKSKKSLKPMFSQS